MLHARNRNPHRRGTLKQWRANNPHLAVTIRGVVKLTPLGGANVAALFTLLDYRVSRPLGKAFVLQRRSNNNGSNDRATTRSVSDINARVAASPTFRAACASAGVNPTARQAARWRQRCGQAWEAYCEIREALREHYAAQEA